MSKPKSSETPWTMPVPQAGREYYGAGRNTSYKLAKDGTMPTIRVGGQIKALPRVIEAKLSGAQTDGAGTTRKRA